MVNIRATSLAGDTEYFALVAVVMMATARVLVVVKYYLLGMHECISLRALLACFVASMIILVVGRSAI